MGIEEQNEFNKLAAIVKTKGFMGLDSLKDRNRYRELKAMIADDNDEPTLTKADAQRMIDAAIEKYKSTVKSEVKEINEDDGLSDLIRLGKWMKAKAPKKANPTARIKLYREDAVSEPGLIIDMKFLKWGFDEETRKTDVPIYRITALYDSGETKEYDLPLVQIAQINETEVVEIIKMDIEDMVMSQGTGQKPYSKGGYYFSSPGLFGTKTQVTPGETFTYEVKKQEITCTVKRPNGKTLVLDASKLNQ